MVNLSRFLRGERSSHLLYNMGRDGALADDRLAPAADPVNSRWLLVCAVVTAEAQNLKSGKVLSDLLEGFLCALESSNS